MRDVHKHVGVYDCAMFTIASLFTIRGGSSHGIWLAAMVNPTPTLKPSIIAGDITYARWSMFIKYAQIVIMPADIIKSCKPDSAGTT